MPPCLLGKGIRARPRVSGYPPTQPWWVQFLSRLISRPPTRGEFRPPSVPRYSQQLSLSRTSIITGNRSITFTRRIPLSAGRDSKVPRLLPMMHGMHSSSDYTAEQQYPATPDPASLQALMTSTRHPQPNRGRYTLKLYIEPSGCPCFRTFTIRSLRSRSPFGFPSLTSGFVRISAGCPTERSHRVGPVLRSWEAPVHRGELHPDLVVKGDARFV